MRKGEWRYWGGDAGSTRYSALDQINATNARELQIAWRWQSLPGDGEPDSNFKATPLMVDGVLYTSAGVHQAAAIDPKTGTTLWVFTPIRRKLQVAAAYRRAAAALRTGATGARSASSSTRSTAASFPSTRAPARPIRSSV